jgi:hypothetical protein
MAGKKAQNASQEKNDTETFHSGSKGSKKAEIKKGPVPERTGPISVQFSQMITAGRDRG